MDDGPGESKVSRNYRNTNKNSRYLNVRNGGRRGRGGASFKRSQFRLNPLKQAFFVALAIAGIAIGYGLGFLLKDEPAPAPQVAAKPEAAKPMVAPEARTENEPGVRAPARSLAAAPVPLRATTLPYEEPLTQEVIENPAVTESPPEPQKPEPKPEMKKEPEPKPGPELEPKPLPVVVAAPKTGQSRKSSSLSTTSASTNRGRRARSAFLAP